MNVGCSGCGTVFRVDPDKVPESGVRARCSVCAEVFWVRRESAAAPRVAPLPQKPAPSARPLAPEPGRAVPPPPAAPPWPEVVPPPFRAPARSGEGRGLSGERTLGSAAAFGPATPPGSGGIDLAPGAAAPRGRGRTNPFLAQDPAGRARRLARALVSDIVVYNPAKRREALRDGSLRTRFEEEIRKSWEEYVDQIGRELAESTPYFTDALNEILADGRKVFS